MSQQTIPEQEKKAGWLSRLKEGMKRSSSKISENITALVTKRKLDQETLDELEEVLISADLGVTTAQKIIASLKKQRFNQDMTSEQLREFIAGEIEIILQPYARPVTINEAKPHVVIVVGVNGSGKTTTIGKLTKHWQDSGYSLLLASGDTFRAAATEQLQVWADRLDVPLIKGQAQADPSGVAYEALQRAQRENKDIVIIDTAGRLHNKESLMAELAKIGRVLQKLDPTSPHSCLLVLDATVGQNVYNQVEAFRQIIGVTGLIMTKLDGTARGGVLVGLSERFQLPVHAIGVGEGVDDLQPFNSRNFSRSLMGIE